MYALPISFIINPNILNRQVWSGDFSGVFVGEARASAYVIFLSLFALILIWLISKIRNQRNKKIFTYSILSFGVLLISWASYSLVTPNGFLQRIYLKQATAVRPITWEVSNKIFLERPVFGWGMDNFERVFEAHYDNRVLQDEYGNEAWLDRAHNVVIDHLVDGGAVGLGLYILVYLVIIFSLVYSALNSPEKNDRILSAILLVYFPLHFIELQTAFETSISYPILAFMMVSAVILFQRVRKTVNWETGRPAITYPLSVFLLFFVIWSTVWGLSPLLQAEIVNGQMRAVKSAEERIPLYPRLISSPVDPHAFLWRISTDFQRAITVDPEVLSSPSTALNLKKELVVIETEYKNYIKNNPDHFRAKLNLADILIFQNLFQVNKLDEAQKILDEAIELVPQNPQSYWIKAVAYIYMGKFKEAREYAKKGLTLNPKIKQSQEIVDYVENSIKTFPEVELFFFRQI